MSRLSAATLLSLLAGPLLLAPAKPPDLPASTTIDCAVAQAPEMPIDGLLVESAVDLDCSLCDIVVDVLFPLLRLRHIPLVMQCPCFKVCCESMQKTVAHCCASIKNCPVQTHAEECACPHCPAVSRCQLVIDEASEDDQEEAEPADETQPEAEVLEVMPHEEAQSDDAKDAGDKQDGPPKTKMPTCPYLKEKMMSCPAEAAKAETDLETCPKTPLENFDRLLKGWHLYRKAQHCRLAGKIERACHLYERAKKLCPGSRIEELADKQLEKLYAQKAVPEIKPATEEAEPAPCSSNGCNYDRLREECGTMVDELRARASKLMEEGRYVEGYLLAEMAIKLSADCEDAIALLAKTQDVLNTPKTDQVCPGNSSEEKSEEPQNDGDQADERNSVAPEPPSDGDEAEDSKPVAPKSEADGGADDDVMPPAEEPSEPPEVGPLKLIQPPLPPVDPHIVEALEKVLREIGDPASPKMVIEVDEPAAEEQEDAVSTWPYVPPQTDVPSSLLGDPQDDELTLGDEDDGIPSPEDQAWRHIGGHLEEMLRNTVEALQQHVCTSVDIDGSNGPRGRVNFQIGNVQCTLVCDGWGHRLVIVRLTPEATGDLREVQQSLNDGMLHWIDLMNSGGSGMGDEEEATTGDDDDDDLLYYDEPYPVG